MPTTLDSDGNRLFNYLLSIAPAVNPEAGEGFLTYLAAHKALGLSKGGFTWGDSLDKQGMGNVAHWARDNGYPAITGFIVSEESMMPAKGFFRFYGKDPDSDFAWWLSEVKAAKAFNWPGTDGTSASPSFVDVPKEGDEPRRGARFVSDIATPESRFFLKSEWGPISAYWPALSFSKRSVGDYLNENYNPAKDFIVFAGTSDPNRTEVPEHRQALLSILITEPGRPLATSELVPWESWQEQLEKHGRNWPYSFGVRAGWTLTELPSARSLTPAAYRALGIRSNWGGVSEITADEKQALYSQPIEWVTLPNRGVVNAASAKRDRIRDMREKPSLNSALVRLQDLIRNRLGPPQSVRVNRPGRHLPPGQDLIGDAYFHLTQQANHLLSRMPLPCHIQFFVRSSYDLNWYKSSRADQCSGCGRRPVNKCGWCVGQCVWGTADQRLLNWLHLPKPRCLLDDAYAESGTAGSISLRALLSSGRDPLSRLYGFISYWRAGAGCLSVWSGW